MSSEEQTAALLARIKAAGVHFAPADEAAWRAMLAVFVPALRSYDPRDLRVAAIEWCETKRHWPALAELVAEVNEAKRRREQRENPPQGAGAPIEATHRSRARGLPAPPHDPEPILRTIRDIQSHPERYAMPDALIKLGKAFLEKRGHDLKALGVEPLPPL
jgi:hypothetical protein